MKKLAARLLLSFLLAPSINAADICSSNNICILNKMPLYNQSSRELIDYINKAKGLNLSSDPGYCGMVSSAMMLRGIGLHKKSGSIMGGLWSSSSSAYPWTRFAYEGGKLVKTDFRKGGTDSSDAAKGIKSLREKSYISKGKKSFYGISSYTSYNRGAFFSEVYENIDVSPSALKARIKKYRPAHYIGVGAYQKYSSRKSKQTCWWKWKKRWGIKIELVRRCRTDYYTQTSYRRKSGHALTINGYDGNFFKIYDPWGRIYNVEMKSFSSNHILSESGLLNTLNSIYSFFAGSSYISKKLSFEHVSGQAGFAKYSGSYRTLLVDSITGWSLEQ